MNIMTLKSPEGVEPLSDAEKATWPYPPVDDGIPDGDDTTNVPSTDYAQIFES